MAWQKKLCGLGEAARILGVSDTRVSQFSKDDPLFPEEIDQLSCGRVWRYDDIEQYRLHRQLVLAARETARQASKESVF
jgi:hypothetical protein